MDDSILIRIECEGTSHAVVVEDDGRVAYAYLLDGEEIVGDVWLYNRCAAPPTPEWTTPEKMPFANPEGYVKPDGVTPIESEADVNVSWILDDGRLRAARVLLAGEVWAELRPGEKPGFSRMALKDGPLAKVLVA